MTPENKNHPFKNQSGPVIAINAKLFAAALFAALAWLMWPANRAENLHDWWQFALLSILVGAGALVTLIDAIKAIVRYRERQRVLEAYKKLTPQKQGARLVDDETLRASGMTHV